MRKILGKSIVLFFIFVGLCTIFSCVVVAADPTIVSIVTDPINPVPESTVTVTANISGEDISSVNVTISECFSEGENVACFEWQTVKMSLNSDDLYEATFNLIDKLDRTNHITYDFTVISNGISYEFKGASRANLSIDSGNNNNNNAGEKEKNKGIPGFETILMLIALVIGVILFKQKRSR